LVAGCPRGPYDLGTRATFADLGATVLDLLGVTAPLAIGHSFAAEMGLG
jgi:phosphopentomutase